MTSASEAAPPELTTELERKAVHIGMGGFALLLRWMVPWQAILMAISALVLNVFFLHRLTGNRLLRREERKSGFSLGIVTYPAVLLLVFVIFRSRLELAAGVWGLLAVGDGLAAVAGLLLGGPTLRWNRKKRWTGLITFVVFGTAASAFLIRWTQQALLAGTGADGGPVTWIGASFIPGGIVDLSVSAPLLVGCFAAALLAALAESLDTSLDDNFLVPMVGAAVLLGATLVEPLRLMEAGPALVQGVLMGLAINIPLAALAYLLRSVDRYGTVGGVTLGAALFAFAGAGGFLMLVALVVIGTAVTRLGHDRKAALGMVEGRGGRRGAASAFANAGAGVVFAFLSSATAHTELFTLAMVAAFATAAFDTTATEVGVAFGRRHFLVGAFRPVPGGTDGAVSVEGTSAGAAGSLLVAAGAWGVGLVSGVGVLVVMIGSFFGSMLESYLGAIFGPGRGADHHLLNLANTIVGAGVACWLHVQLT